jgi:hypothetical protein
VLTVVIILCDGNIIFHAQCTITNVDIDEYSPSAFHRELQKYLLEMPLSPTSIPTDIVCWQSTINDGQCEF